MSGTSLDGLDLCCVEFSGTSDQPIFNIIATKTYRYSTDWESRLRSIEQGSGLDLVKTDADLGKLFGSLTLDFIEEFNLENIDAIASHGHTIFHQPQLGFTTQIGHPAQVKAKTGITTIGDFRSLDVALSGQGAPLVPIGDQLLFGDYASCLNLGGIANVSYEKHGKRIAFDISVCNMALNHLAQLCGVPYDANGDLANDGHIIQPLLDSLNQLEYYTAPPPKSLGKEDFIENVLPLLQEYYDPKDMLATMTQHIGAQIGKTLPEGKCLITGGGAYNNSLIEAIQTHSTAQVVVPSNELIEFKEALIFAFLGYLRLHEQTNTLKSVTGGRSDSIGGAVYL